DGIKITGWNYTTNAPMGLDKSDPVNWKNDPRMVSLCAAQATNCVFEGIRGLGLCHANNVDNYNLTYINCSNSTASSHALYIPYLNNVSAHNIKFTDGLGSAIIIYKSENVSVYDCNITNAGNYKKPTTGQFAVSFQGSNNSTAHDIYADGSGWSTITVSPSPPSKNVTVYNCTVFNSGHNSLDLHGCQYVTCSNLSLNDSVGENILVTYSGGDIYGASNIYLKDIKTAHHCLPYGCTHIGAGASMGAEASNITVENFSSDGDSNGIGGQSLDNLTVYNLTVTNTSGGMTWTKSIYVKTAFAYNTSMIDSDVYSARYESLNVLYSRNARIINTHYNPQKAVFGVGYDGEGTVGYYGDFVVKNATGTLLNGTITLSNETGEYTGTDAAAKNKSVFSFSGRTPLPSDRANSIAIPEYYKNTLLTLQGKRIDYSTIADISTSSGNVQLDNIVPDQRWYRDNISESKYTITALINDSENLHFIGYAPSPEYNNFESGDSVKMQVWANEHLTNVVWKVDGVTKQSGTATTYEAIIGEAPVTVDLTGSTATETISKSWVIDPEQTVDPNHDPEIFIPVADFIVDSSSGSKPATFAFSDSSTNSHTNWYWDFEKDGKTDSTEQNPVFTYKTAGNYTVKLTISNAAGVDHEVKQAYVQVTETPLTKVNYFSRFAGLFNSLFRQYFVGAWLI
ncbi:MAG: PKD domain-containing protein, partial [Parabacteroides sp.]